MSEYRIEYENDVGDDEGFCEWWQIYEDDRHIASCDEKSDAEAIARKLRHFDAMERALREVIQHVEDPNVERLPPSQCTLCRTYRMKIHNALTAYDNDKE